jgi:Ni/Fe-hydrogenase subunit HybB-like protein
MFLARALVVLVVWLGLGTLLRNRLAGVDDPASRRRFARACAVFLVLLAPTISVASWDWAMSLQPEWSSTMFAVYGFAGTYLGGIAAVTLIALRQDEREGLRARLADGARHDLGKLLFAFSLFWAYIWFCQYLLIWYSNLPEETPYYAARLSGGWSTLFWLNPILNFAVPFVVLMSERAKKSRTALVQVSIVVLLGRWIDSYLNVGPAVAPLPAFPVYAVASSIALLVAMGVTIGGLRRGARPTTLESLSPRATRSPATR